MSEVQLLTPTEAAKRIGVSRATIYNMIQKKRIKHYRFQGSGTRPIYRIDETVVNEIVETREPNNAHN